MGSIETFELTFRTLLRIVLLACALLFIARWCFQSSPLTRRQALLALGLGLLIGPVLLAWWNFRWRLPTDGSVLSFLDRPVPLTLLLAWAAGSVVLLVRELLTLRHTCRSLAALPRMHDDRLCRLVRNGAQQAGLRIQPVLCVGQTAAASSLWQPLVVVPRDYAAWPTVALEALLSHELVHLRRRDDRLLLLLRLVHACYWWVPGLGAVLRQAECAIEESCDDAAATLLGSSTRYLDGVAAAARLLRPELAVVGFAPGLVSRVARFNGHRELGTDSGGLFWAACLLLSVLVVGTGIESDPAPPASGEPYLGLLPRLQVSGAESHNTRWQAVRFHWSAFDPLDRRTATVVKPGFEGPASGRGPPLDRLAELPPTGVVLQLR